jgi:hypothetical protein
MKTLIFILSLLIASCGTSEPETSLTDDTHKAPVEEPYDGDIATCVFSLNESCEIKYTDLGYTLYNSTFDEFYWNYEEVIPYLLIDNYREWEYEIKIPSNVSSNEVNYVMCSSNLIECGSMNIEFYFNESLIEKKAVTSDFNGGVISYKLEDLRNM